MKLSHAAAGCIALFALAGAEAWAKGPPTCPVPKSGPSCPQSFTVITDPDAPPVTINVNDPVVLMAECVPRRNGLTCEAWPQEYATIGYLTYQWTIRVGLSGQTTYPESTNPVRIVSCTPMQSVQATVTIRNGNYSATTSTSWGCGNEAP